MTSMVRDDRDDRDGRIRVTGKNNKGERGEEGGEGVYLYGNVRSFVRRIVNQQRDNEKHAVTTR